MKKEILIGVGILLIFGISITSHLIANRYIGYEPYVPNRIEWLRVLMELHSIEYIAKYNAPVSLISLSRPDYDDNGIEFKIIWNDDADSDYKNVIGEVLFGLLESEVKRLYVFKHWTSNPIIYYIEEQDNQILVKEEKLIDTTSKDQISGNRIADINLNGSDNNRSKQENSTPIYNEKVLTVMELFNKWNLVRGQRIRILLPKGAIIETATITCMVGGKGMINFHFPANEVRRLSNITDEYSQLTKNLYIKGTVDDLELDLIGNVNNCTITN